jgi:predicted XRE-type DNA-binding protein
MKPGEKVHRGSGNVFADIGLKNPKRVLARSRVMMRIADLIRQRGLTQQQASKLLGIPQSKVSCLMNGKLSMFSLDRLFELLNTLDSGVEIIIRPKTEAERIATTEVFMAEQQIKRGNERTP